MTAPPAPPAPPPPPKVIPASAVQYLEPPVLEYPRASRRAGESGRVLLRVYIDETGLPRQVLLAQSSGFARLDDAALTAMKKARFKPYTENGQPTAGWAPAPIDFELER
jgi:protein TonB